MVGIALIKSSDWGCGLARLDRSHMVCLNTLESSLFLATVARRGVNTCSRWMHGAHGCMSGYGAFLACMHGMCGRLVDIWRYCRLDMIL